MKGLEQKIFAVTGASDGVGHAIAARLVEEGATVINADRKVPETLLPGLIFVKTDLSHPAQIARLFSELEARNIELDGFVNNAGITIQGNFFDFPQSDIDLMLNVNLRAVLLCCQAAARAMRKVGRGVIVNIASVHHRATAPGFEAYAATKAGIVAMTKAMAHSLGPYGIRVNSVSPGLVRTPAIEKWLELEPEAEAVHAAMTATGEILKPADIAKVAAFLLSDDASGLTGCDLLADRAAHALLFKNPATDDAP